MCQREIFELITEEARYACKANRKIFIDNQKVNI